MNNELIVQNQYYGFVLLKITKSKRLRLVIYVFKHIKTGSRLVFINNNDDNKVFSITLNTPPVNDTGIAHIVEHSVLCGSQRYPYKEAFSYVKKGSLATYMNAMTSINQTTFSVASINEDDLKNLVTFYLDSIWNSLIDKSEEVFLEQGWRFDYNKAKEEFFINGVVYNEMQGAFSNMNRLLSFYAQRSLFSESDYQYAWDGIPSSISTLQHEDIVNYYNKYYTPTNSILYLYGNLQIDEYLKKINEEFLSNCDFKKVVLNDNKIISSKVLCENRYYYNYNKDGKIYFTANYVFGTTADIELNLSIHILIQMLFGANSSLIKNYLVSEKICEDVKVLIHNSFQQPFFSIVLSGCNMIDLEEIKFKFEKKLREICILGINKDILSATWKKVNFVLKEQKYNKYPKGLIYCMEILKVINENEDLLLEVLDQEDVFENIQRQNTGYFENLIQKYLLDNSHSTFILLQPTNDMNLIDRIFKPNCINNLSVDKESIVQNIEKYKYFQSKSKRSEDSVDIPFIKVSSITNGINSFKYSSFKENDFCLLHTIMDNEDIIYYNVCFKLGNLSSNDYQYVGLLCNVLGKIGTRNYDKNILDSLKSNYLGGLNIRAETIYNKAKGYDTPTLIINAKLLKLNTEHFWIIINEVINNYIFNDFAQIKSIIKKTKSKIFHTLISSPHRYGLLRCLSYFSKGAYFEECTSGIKYYKFLLFLEGIIDDKFDEIQSRLSEVAHNVFLKENLVISITSSNPLEKDSSKGLYLPKNTNQHTATANISVNHITSVNEAFVINNNVQSNVKAGNISESNLSYYGLARVIESILNSAYLWDNVRTLGGAYGAQALFRFNGDLAFISYMDPNVSETYNIFDNAANYLRDLKLSERELNDYIVGAFGSMEIPINNYERGMKSIRYELGGITAMDIENEKKELLNISQNDLFKMFEIIDAWSKKSLVCTIGNNNVINKNSSLFNSIDIIT